MDTKIALLTGSTGGIGLEIAQQLASEGWNLILLNRSKSKMDAQISSLKQAFPDQQFSAYVADLMDLSQLKKTLAKVAEDFQQIHALYNIAGFLSYDRVMSAQDIEGHFAVNAVAPYLTLKSLTPNLAAASGSDQMPVIVNFSTEAIKGVKALDASILVNPEKIGGLMGAYATSKMAINVITQVLKDDLEKSGVAILSVDPGATKSEMTDKGDGMPWFIKLLRPLLFKPASEQTKKILSAVKNAVSEKQTGLHISSGKVIKEHPVALDTKVQQEVIQLLDSLVDSA